MMAASSGFLGASGGRSAHSEAPSSTPSISHPSPSFAAAEDDEFGSFASAERLSDPFGDVYGEFGDFVDNSSGTEQVVLSTVADDVSSLMSFSPVKAPAPPTLLPSISSEMDPFADITGGLRALEDEQGGELDVSKELEAEAAATTSTRAILDLVWNTKQELNPLSTSSSSVNSRTASNPGGFSLPPPPSNRAATFPIAAARTPETSTGDLLSFSPVQADAPKDPFFGINDDPIEASAFGDEGFTFTTTAVSSTSLSAPNSLRGSFASLHEEAKPSIISPTEVDLKALRDPFVERTTRSFGSLSSSFVSVGTMEDTCTRNGVRSSFNTFTAAPEAAMSSITPSPSSAPPSLRSSFMTDGFMGFASTADESDEVDPFAEAGLTAPEEVPLAEALAAWNTSADPVETDEMECVVHEKTLLKDSDADDMMAIDDRTNIQNTFGPPQLPVSEVHQLDVWDNSTTNTPTPNDEQVDYRLSAEQRQLGDVSVHVSATAVEYEMEFVAEFTESTEVISFSEVDDNENVLIPDEDEGGAKSYRFQGTVFDNDEKDGDNDGVLLSTASDVVWPVKESAMQSTGDLLQDDQANSLDVLAPVRKVGVKAIEDTLGGALSSEGSTLPSTFSTSFSTPVAADLSPQSEKFDGGFVWESNTKDNTEQDGVDDTDFVGFEAADTPTGLAIIPDASPWGSFPSPSPVQTMSLEDDSTSNGDFAVAGSSPAVELSAVLVTEDDGFADFGQSSEPSGDDEFGDFGDFSQSASGDGFSDFQQSNSEAFDDDDDGFGDFTPASTAAITAVTSPLSTIPATRLSKSDLSAFFKDAFVIENVQTDPLPVPDSPPDVDSVVQEPSTDFVQGVFRTMWEEYFGIIATTGRHPSTSSGSLSPTSVSSDVERVQLGRKTTRASKYLKYVLSEKIQEASRQNGIFPHGSERHEMYVGLTASGDADRMRAALKELQDALFHSSVNEAMMRIAKQAALSAKAKIAEQAAQQQSNSRGGSLFSTTRNLLSRGGSAVGAHGPSSNDSKADHASADTPTGASVQKLARFSFTTNHEDTSNDHRAASGDERGSEGSDHTVHSSGSESEAVGGASDSRTRSQTLSASGTSGGLMKKFQDRFSFASSRHRPRFVSLRRKGQSGEEVRKMELNLDAISGGLDEVKWKCAMFLYDVEEVAHVAPSQINILSYPGNQPLTGKTDRSALTKLVKPETIWTVDIGANNSDVLNEW